MNGVVMWDFDGTLATRPGLWSTCMLEVLDERSAFRPCSFAPRVASPTPWPRLSA